MFAVGFGIGRGALEWKYLSGDRFETHTATIVIFNNHVLHFFKYFAFVSGESSTLSEDVIYILLCKVTKLIFILTT